MDISKNLLIWYSKNKRDLPWRRTKDPYTIWVSEIILQQTRVDQGLDYYHRFLERFPDVITLSAANEDDVLSVWKGLGYYSRARNMHATARFVVSHLKGVFPSDYKSLLKLKGIGTYTAAAISSICGNEPTPVVDGNVVRVISRIYGIDDQVGSTLSQTKVFEKALSLIDKKNPGDFNQAVMEFGATWCKPANPFCPDCIFSLQCYAFNNNMVNQLPAKKREVSRRNRYLNYLCIVFPGRGIIMTKRTENDIWRNLWEPLLYESVELLSVEMMKKTDLWQSLPGLFSAEIIKTFDFRHILTHQVIFARFFLVNAATLNPGMIADSNLILDNPLTSGLPVSRLIELFLQKAGAHFEQ